MAYVPNEKPEATGTKTSDSSDSNLKGYGGSITENDYKEATKEKTDLNPQSKAMLDACRLTIDDGGQLGEQFDPATTKELKEKFPNDGDKPAASLQLAEQFDPAVVKALKEKFGDSDGVENFDGLKDKKDTTAAELIKNLARDLNLGEFVRKASKDPGHTPADGSADAVKSNIPPDALKVKDPMEAVPAKHPEDAFKAEEPKEAQDAKGLLEKYGDLFKARPGDVGPVELPWPPIDVTQLPEPMSEERLDQRAEDIVSRILKKDDFGSAETRKEIEAWMEEAAKTGQLEDLIAAVNKHLKEKGSDVELNLDTQSVPDFWPECNPSYRTDYHTVGLTKGGGSRDQIEFHERILVASSPCGRFPFPPRRPDSSSN